MLGAEVEIHHRIPLNVLMDLIVILRHALEHALGMEEFLNGWERYQDAVSRLFLKPSV